MVKDFPMIKTQGRESNQPQASGPSFDASKRNHFYALKYSGNQEVSPKFVTGMLQVFSINVYALLDPGATLSFVSPLVAKNFDVLPDVLIEPFLVSTSEGHFVVAKRVYSNIIVLYYFPIK